MCVLVLLWAPGDPWPGKSGETDRPGYVKVYYKQLDCTWLLAETFTGDFNGDYFGRSVSLSADGKTLAIGAPGNDGNGDRSGHVRVYNLVSRVWQKIGQDIDGEAAGDLSGTSVSLSADGTTVAIGADLNDDNGNDSGHVRVYTVVGSEWQQIGQDIDGEAAVDASGWSVSLSADGSTVAIGAPNNDGNGDISGRYGDNSGHVRVYNLVGSEWQQVGSDIDGEAAVDYSGMSVSLSADGNTVAIGADGNGNGDYSGHVRVYTVVGSEWQQIGQDIDGEAADDSSGRSVSLSADGTTVAIGAPWNNGNGSDSGHVRVYHLDISGSSSSWVQVGNEIDGVAVGDELGYSVSLSADGKSVAVGSPYNDDNGADAGHAQVFSVPSSSPITSAQPSYPPSQNVSYWYKIFICFVSYSLIRGSLFMSL